MTRIGLFLLMLLIFISCSNDSNENKGNTAPEKKEIKLSSIIGKWKVTDENPVLEGSFISEYFMDNTFQQTGEITSFQPSYTCKSSSNGTYSLTNGILSYSYLAEKMFDCQPQEYQLMVDSYMGNKVLETSQNKIILLNEKTMIQENLETKKQFTFLRIME
jgi:hypothetical protein